MAQRTFCAGENPGEIETEFQSRYRAVDLDRLAWISPHSHISNNHRSEERRFNFTNLKPQPFTLGGALRPHPQTARHDERREANHEKRADEQYRGRNNEQSSCAHLRFNALAGKRRGGKVD